MVVGGLIFDGQNVDTAAWESPFSPAKWDRFNLPKTPVIATWTLVQFLA